MEKYTDPNKEFKEFKKKLKKDFEWWVRPGWKSIFLRSLIPGVVVGFIACLFGSPNALIIGVMVWVAAAGFTLFIRNGDGF